MTTLEQKRKNVIKAIKNLLSDTQELGDFGKSKIIDAERLKLAIDALNHLNNLTKDTENEI